MSGKSGLLKHTNKKFFKSVDEWKSSLTILPDSSFFELLRSVFGNIKTPFSKQRLVDDLFVFLSGIEIQKTIAAYINENDHKIIAAIAILGHPSPKDMESFFAGEFSGAELHALIVNLEERLIVYRFRKDDIMRLGLNPVLEKVLMPFIADTGILFPCYLPESDHLTSGQTPEACLPDDRIMAVLFSFLSREEELFRTEWGIRKKTLNEGKRLFPALNLELSIRALLFLGLFKKGNAGQKSGGGRIFPNKEKIAEFGNLSGMERQEYWAAAIYLFLERNTLNNGENNSAGTSDDFPGEILDSGILYRGRLRQIVLAIHQLISFIVPIKTYPENTLRRFWELLKREDDGINTGESGMQLSFELVIEALEKTGFLERKGDCLQAGPVMDFGKKPVNGGETPVIVMDTTFSIILYPEISFTDALALGTFCTIKENTARKPAKETLRSGVLKNADTVVCFEFSRPSVIRGFDGGMSASGMTDLLNRLSHNRIDPNLGWTLKEWESRYAEVSLYQGIILVLEESRRFLADLPPLSSLIQKNLSPGVYLLSTENRQEAIAALKKAGVDIIAQPPPASQISASSFLKKLNASFPRLSALPALESLALFLKAVPAGTAEPARGFPQAGSEKRKETPDSAAIKENFRKVLEKMKLEKQERDELNARIERRLVVSETQLEKASLRYEKLEARGLDYPGKLSIAKHALESGSQVELIWPSPGGGSSQAIGFVEALEKKEGESILIFRNPANYIRNPGNSIRIPGNTIRIPGNTIRIPLGKISFIRRIKKSIFGE